jgi:hypothetical protein
MTQFTVDRIHVGTEVSFWLVTIMDIVPFLS